MNVSKIGINYVYTNTKTNRSQQNPSEIFSKAVYQSTPADNTLNFTGIFLKDLKRSIGKIIKPKDTKSMEQERNREREAFLQTVIKKEREMEEKVTLPLSRFVDENGKIKQEHIEDAKNVLNATGHRGQTALGNIAHLKPERLLDILNMFTNDNGKIKDKYQDTVKDVIMPILIESDGLMYGQGVINGISPIYFPEILQLFTNEDGKIDDKYYKTIKEMLTATDFLNANLLHRVANKGSKTLYKTLMLFTDKNGKIDSKYLPLIKKLLSADCETTYQQLANGRTPIHNVIEYAESTKYLPDIVQMFTYMTGDRNNDVIKEILNVADDFDRTPMYYLLNKEPEVHSKISELIS